MFDFQRGFSIREVGSTGIPLHIILTVQIERIGNGINFINGTHIIVVIAGQLNDIGAQVNKQIHIFRVTAEDKTFVIRVREWAIFEERNFVADVGQIGGAHNAADVGAWIECAFG